MRNTLFTFALLIFAALLIGGYAINSERGLPAVEQVTNPNASTLDFTGSKVGLLAVAVIVVVGATIAVGVGITGLFYVLSREVKRAELSNTTPFSFSLKPEGNSVGTIVQENAVPLSIGLTIFSIIAFIAILFLTGVF